MNDLPEDYEAFIAEAHAAAARYGLTLAWDDTRGALLVRRDHVYVGGDPTQCESCGHSEGHPLHTEPARGAFVDAMLAEKFPDPETKPSYAVRIYEIDDKGVIDHLMWWGDIPSLPGVGDYIRMVPMARREHPGVLDARKHVQVKSLVWCWDDLSGSGRRVNLGVQTIEIPPAGAT